MSRAVRSLAGSMMAALLVIVLNSQTAQAQRATVMMFYGPPLQAPVFVTDADTAPFTNLLQPASMTVKELGDREYVQVALFWASRSDPANNGTHALSALTPAMAWQHGRFYPPAAGKPAVLLVTMMTKGAQPVPIPSNGAAFIWGGPVSPNALAVLQRLKIVPGPGR